MGITWEDLKLEKDAKYFIERIKRGDKITAEEWAIDNVNLDDPDEIKLTIESNKEYLSQIKIAARYWSEEEWPFTIN